MKLEYDLIEDAFDDTTNIRSMTEQARFPGGGWMVRTTLYTPHHLSVAVMFIPGKHITESGYSCRRGQRCYVPAHGKRKNYF